MAGSDKLKSGRLLTTVNVLMFLDIFCSVFALKLLFNYVRFEMKMCTCIYMTVFVSYLDNHLDFRNDILPYIYLKE